MRTSNLIGLGMIPLFLFALAACPQFRDALGRTRHGKALKARQKPISPEAQLRRRAYTPGPDYSKRDQDEEPRPAPTYIHRPPKPQPRKPPEPLHVAPTPRVRVFIKVPQPGSESPEPQPLMPNPPDTLE